MTFDVNVKVNDAFGGNQYEPHIRVDPAGNVHVCWIWNLPFQSNIDLYYSVSDDAGSSWLSASLRANDVAYSVQPYVAWTSDLLADATGHAYLFWNDGRTTSYYDNIYFSTNQPAAGVEAEPAHLVAGYSLRLIRNPGPDPALVLSHFEDTMDLRIEVFDLQGRSLGVPHRGFGSSWSNPVVLRVRSAYPSIAQGAYFARVMVGGATRVRRFVILH
jgi:hypothetical protein